MISDQGAFDCFAIARSLELGAGKLAPRDAERIGEYYMDSISFGVSRGKLTSFKLIAQSYEEAGICVLISKTRAAFRFDAAHHHSSLLTPPYSLSVSCVLIPCPLSFFIFPLVKEESHII